CSQRQRLSRFLPAFGCSGPRYLLAPTLAKRGGASFAAPSPQALRSLVLAVVGREVLFLLPGQDAHDLDGVADHVGGALLAFGSLGHSMSHPAFRVWRGTACTPRT